jgi:broad specificity phosphatase PhoE
MAENRSSFSKLILVRHAHRDTDAGRGYDNGLSEKGREQSEKVSDLIKLAVSKGETVHLFSSPKVRCQETLAPYSKKSGIKVHTIDDLDEGSPFEPKLRRLRARLESLSGSVVFCSHGDVLPELMQSWCGRFYDFKKGECVVIDHSQLKPPSA